jgi:hypothetical protein
LVLRLHRKHRDAVKQSSDRWLHLGFGNLNSKVFTGLPLKFSSLIDEDNVVLTSDPTVMPQSLWVFMQKVQFEKDWDLDSWVLSQSSTGVTGGQFSPGVYINVVRVRPVVRAKIWRRDPEPALEVLRVKKERASRQPKEIGDGEPITALVPSYAQVDDPDIEEGGVLAKALGDLQIGGTIVWDVASDSETDPRPAEGGRASASTHPGASSSAGPRAEPSAKSAPKVAAKKKVGCGSSGQWRDVHFNELRDACFSTCRNRGIC